jgi:hypothetical protein
LFYLDTVFTFYIIILRWNILIWRKYQHIRSMHPRDIESSLGQHTFSSLDWSESNSSHIKRKS